MKSETLQKKELKKEELEKIALEKKEIKKKKASAKKKKKNYVDPVRFKELILLYYKTDDFSEELGVMVNNISEHVAFMPNFINYTYKSDMISDSNFKMVKALNQKKYDPTKGNPFAYFTKICCRSFINVIKKEKRVEDTITRYQDEIYDELFKKGITTSVNDSTTSTDDNYE